MSLPVPSLTFSRSEKGDEFLSKDQVTRLIDDLQRAHTAAVTEALKPVQSEVARLEAAHKEATKAAAKATELERELGETKGRIERRDVAAELLGLSDPSQIDDLHSLYQSRTAGVDASQRPAFRAWAESHLAKPEEAPALVRPLFEAAAKARGNQQSQQMQIQQQTQTRTSVSTSTGRTQTGGGSGGQRITAQDIAKVRPGTDEWRQMRATWREQQGLPPIVDPKKS